MQGSYRVLELFASRGVLFWRYLLVRIMAYWGLSCGPTYGKSPHVCKCCLDLTDTLIAEHAEARALQARPSQLKRIGTRDGRTRELTS